VADVVKSVRIPAGLVAEIDARAAARSVCVSDLLRLGAAWVSQATDAELDRYLPREPGHRFVLAVDEQRRRGWYLAWKCERSDCDAAGNLTVPTRAKAIELFTLLAEVHPKLVEDGSTL
jgi:hypothetical protein